MDGRRTETPKSERDLFLEALERPTPGERTAFLDEALAEDGPPPQSGSRRLIASRL
jgi:hypothetical protein